VLQSAIFLLNLPGEQSLRRRSTNSSVSLSLPIFSSRTTMFNHSQTVVVCGNCQIVICQPTGGIELDSPNYRCSFSWKKG
ncbi:Ribosomal protein S27e, partial [Corchorus capsularis]